MNVSSSISQVIYQAKLPGNIMLKKAYFWPQYNAGKVDRIDPVNNKPENNLNYVKRLSLEEALNNTGKGEYITKGQSVKTESNYMPGIMFEAFA